VTSASAEDVGYMKLSVFM